LKDNKGFSDKQVEKMMRSHQSAIRDAIDSLYKARMNQEIYANMERRDHEFKQGDFVFLNMKNYESGEHRFRPKKKLSSKWSGPFEIIQVISHTAVRLSLPAQYKMHDVFHVSNLWPAQRSEEKFGRDEFQPPPDIINDILEYEVESIIDKRWNGKKRRFEFLVQWKGNPDDISWEKEENLINCQELLDEFKNKHTNIDISKKISKAKQSDKKELKSDKREEKNDVKEDEIIVVNQENRTGKRRRKKKVIFDPSEINLLISRINLGGGVVMCKAIT
jgi:hypothetical protein